jgi:hypothetical protein
MQKVGLRSGSPSTLLNAIDITADFKVWAQDAWRELQEESINWWFRQKLDQTLAITASTDQYAMPTNLETLNARTVTIYQTAKTDEAYLPFVPYEEWRLVRDTVTTAEARPNQFTIRPDEVIQVWPVPDDAYTLRFDGVYDIDEMLLDADTPGSNIAGSTTLPDRYHWVLVYGTALRYAEHHDDSKQQDLDRMFRAQHARLTEKQTPPVDIPPGVLTGIGNTRFRDRRLY